MQKNILMYGGGLKVRWVVTVPGIQRVNFFCLIKIYLVVYFYKPLLEADCSLMSETLIPPLTHQFLHFWNVKFLWCLPEWYSTNKPRCDP